MHILYQFRDGSIILPTHPWAKQICEFLDFVQQTYKTWETSFIDVDRMLKQILVGRPN